MESPVAAAISSLLAAGFKDAREALVHVFGVYCKITHILQNIKPRLAEKEPSGSKIEQAAEFALGVERLCIQIGIWGYELDKYQVYARFVLIDAVTGDRSQSQDYSTIIFAR